MDQIKALGTLYKKAIEIFSGVSNRKVKFYSTKLSKLLMGANKMAQKANKPASKWSQYMDAHKKSSNKFMLFLSVETSKQEAVNVLNNNEEIFKKGFEQVKNNLDEQSKKFLENKKKKKNMKKKINTNNSNNLNSSASKSNNDNINNSANKSNNNNPDEKESFLDRLKGRNDKVDESINDFMKKFHYIYLHSKIFELPIEKVNQILEEICGHKIEKYYYYQDEIKKIKLMLEDNENEEKDEEGGGEQQHDDTLAFLLKDAQNERKSYNLALENLVVKSINDINTMCEESTVDEDKKMKIYLDELMTNFSKIFI